MNGTGSLLAWAHVTNGDLAVTGLSWMNPAETSRNSTRQSGFTNSDLEMWTSPYDPSQKPFAGATNLSITFDEGLLGIPVKIKSDYTFANTSSVNYLNKVKGKINKTTGIITGTIADPATPTRTAPFTSALLQNQTNALGYFVGASNQVGAIRIVPK